MKIVNTNDLLKTNERRKPLLDIIEAGFEVIDPKAVIRDSIRLEGNQLCVQDITCSLATTKRIFVIGVGKCAVEAAEALEEILGEKIFGGIVLDVSKPNVCTLKKIECLLGTHPMPSEKNIDATKKMIQLLADVTAEDVVLCIVSGGGSTLLCLPEEGATCVEEQAILTALFRAGAPIQDINVIRKHMSLARGGYVAKYAYPAQVISLIFSDVPGDDISFVASGPTVKDATTIEDADRILEKYTVLKTCGLQHCGLIETPKEDMYFERVRNSVVSTNKDALRAMAKRAGALGFSPDIRTDHLSGEAREVAERIVKELRGAPPKSVLLYAGETTVTIIGSGSGGRNQELALSALRFVSESEMIGAIASDGRDNGKYAGAIADVAGRKKAEEAGLDIPLSLEHNDSASFFEKTGDYFLTGDTGSNVSDLIIALK